MSLSTSPTGEKSSVYFHLKKIDDFSPSSNSLRSFRTPLAEKISSEITLGVKEIYKKIKFFICKVNGEQNTEGTGFFLAPRLIVTTAHIKAVSIQYDGKEYTVSDASIDHYSPKKAAHFDLQLLQIKKETPFSLDRNDFFEFSREYVHLEEGEEVYFAGYPLTQKVVTFHKGYISSLSEVNKFHSFTIDGTVVPGNSGGPVLMQKNGRLLLIGVIRSEVSDLHPEFQKITNLLGTIKTTEPLSFIIDNIQHQAVPMGMATNLHMAFSALSANLSTGIGKAVNAYHLHDIFTKSKEDNLISGGGGNFDYFFRRISCWEKARKTIHK